MGNATIGHSTTAEVTLTNTGKGPGTLGAVSATAPFGAVKKDCGASLKVGDSCKVTISFTPSVEGEAKGNLQVAYQDGAAPKSLSLSLKGNGIGLAILVASQPKLIFGSTVVGASIERTLSITNTGHGPATLDDPKIALPFAVTKNDCGRNLNAGASCVLAIGFSPKASKAETGKFELEPDAMAKSP